MNWFEPALAITPPSHLALVGEGEIIHKTWDGRIVRVACGHGDTVPVESVVTGDILAYLCLRCDAQLDPDGQPRRPEPRPMEGCRALH